MNIIINGEKETYKITSDYKKGHIPRQYILSMKKIIKEDTNKHKKGDIYYCNIGNYPSLDTLFYRLLGICLMQSDTRTLKELKTKQNELKLWLKEEFRGEI